MTSKNVVHLPTSRNISYYATYRGAPVTVIERPGFFVLRTAAGPQRLAKTDPDLVLGGRVDIVADYAQEVEARGGLVAIVCGYGR